LSRRLGLAIGTVSEQLTTLRAAGLLTATRRGREVRYSRTALGETLLGR
jgi:DNA-binding transcriptional ArsR family regulator